MIKKISFSLIALILALNTLIFPISATENTASEAKKASDAIISYKAPGGISNWISSSLSENAGIGSEWYALALAQSGEYDLAKYSSSLEKYTTEAPYLPAPTMQKLALCLSAVGSTNGYISQVMESTIGAQGIMSYIFGLHLLNNGYISPDTDTESVISHMLSLQKDDGSWKLAASATDVDITAMAVQALAPHKDISNVSSAIEDALGFLSDSQKDDGGFISYGVSNSESIAQVIMALSALGIDCENDPRFIKNGNTLFSAASAFRKDSGGFCHELGGAENENATSQMLLAYVSYMRMQEGNGSVFLLDRADPENVLSSPKNDPDTDKNNSSEPKKDAFDYKIATLAIIAVITIGLATYLFFAGKRNIKSYIALLCAALSLSAFVIFTNIQSPDDYYGALPEKKDPIGSVTITIRCDLLDKDKRPENIPSDGFILKDFSVPIENNESVYDILIQAAKANTIHIENNGTASLPYIAGIANIYEFENGDTSGWTYLVNGTQPSEGCANYILSDGDKIEWVFKSEL